MIYKSVLQKAWQMRHITSQVKRLKTDLFAKAFQKTDMFFPGFLIPLIHAGFH